MLKIHKRLFLALIMAAACMAACAADGTDSCRVLRPVSSSYSMEYGSAHIADTYLTPLHYRGYRSALNYERDQAMRFSPEKWTMQLKLSGIFEHTDNPARNATMLNAAVRAGWCMMRRHRTACGVTLGYGPGASLDAGVLYLSRNGNNPASAKASLTLDATAYAAWSGRIGRLPLTLRYQPTLPVAGVFFSPDYGQLYYQIYLGQDSGLAHAAWWGSYFALDNLLTADLHFGNTSLRVGYHGSILSTKASNIVTRDISHALVLGITVDWISLSPTHRTISNATLIQSY